MLSFPRRYIRLVFPIVILLVSTPIAAYTPFAVYGQADYNSGLINRGGLASASTLNYPLGLALSDDGDLYVADRDNHLRDIERWWMGCLYNDVSSTL